jgi:methionyl-tRNA formyltransferase
LRTVYLGTSDFAASVLRTLAGSDHAPELVVTPPDSRRGRGRQEHPPPAAETARELDLEVFQAASVNEPEARDAIAAAHPDALVVCAFGQLIKEPLLSDFPILNVHPSLLPRWRGAAPIERALMAGDARTGVAIMRLTEGLDSGPVALMSEVEIGRREDFAALERKLADLGGRLLVKALDQLEWNKLEFTDQDEELATYAEKIDASERRLDPGREAVELERTVRALGRRLGTYLELEGDERLGVRAARALSEGPAPGEFAAGENLVLGCQEGGLRLDVVQPPGKREMDAAEFLRGNPHPARVRFSHGG